jgi:hypothetical protein
MYYEITDENIGLYKYNVNTELAALVSQLKLIYRRQ